jgi:hypothetical protein
MRYFLDWDVDVLIFSNMADGAWKPSRRIHDLIVREEWADESGP